MIIGLEWIALGLCIAAGASLILCVVFNLLQNNAGIVLSAITVILELSFLLVYVGTINAQADVEEHYVDYLKLQTKVAQYEELDAIQQYKVSTDVMTYNLWYERNKADLENEWSFKGSSDYAKEFDYIVIGG